MEDRQVQQMKQQIASYMAKTDYYEVLGLSRDCEEVAVKKAYKKLALRFHPDKNKVQGSVQVFKKVSMAYTTLSNSEKRQRYDRFGPQQQIIHRTWSERQSEEFEQIFKAFFKRAHNDTDNTRQRNSSTSNIDGQQVLKHIDNFFTLVLKYTCMCCLSIIFIFLIVYMIIAYFQTTHQFKLESQRPYDVQMITEILQTPYYVKQGYFQNDEMTVTGLSKKDIDQLVQIEYINKLNKKCKHIKKKIKGLQIQLKYQKKATKQIQIRQMISNINKKSCKTINSLKTQFPDYVPNLLQKGGSDL